MRIARNNHIDQWVQEVDQLQEIKVDNDPSMLASGVETVGQFIVDLASGVGGYMVNKGATALCREAVTAVVPGVVGEVAGQAAGIIGGGVVRDVKKAAIPYTQYVENVAKQGVSLLANKVDATYKNVKSLWNQEELPNTAEFQGRIEEIQTNKQKNRKLTIFLSVVFAVIAVAVIAGIVASAPYSIPIIAAAAVIAVVVAGIISFFAYHDQKEAKKSTQLINVYDAYINHIEAPNPENWVAVASAIQEIKPVQENN